MINMVLISHTGSPETQGGSQHKLKATLWKDTETQMKGRDMID